MWFTAIKYLTEDPTPSEVVALLNAGQEYKRYSPCWIDPDDSELCYPENVQTGRHSHSYSQAEVDGLPDLIKFLHRTALIHLNRVEGVTEQTRQRVSRAIPFKGSGLGEPLDIVKKFATWVAWKRGNELLPGWAYIRAELETPVPGEKKLSAAAQKRREREAALEAHRALNPGRHSERAKQFRADAAVKQPDASSPSDKAPRKRKSSVVGQSDAKILGPDGMVLNTPKTSVLGPKRVACDACRKRRVRCKHKNEQAMGSDTKARSNGILQSPDQLPVASANGASGPVAWNKLNLSTTDKSVANQAVVPTEASYSVWNSQMTNSAQGESLSTSNGFQISVGSAVPMASDINGTTQTPNKRGRVKACDDCRRSKVRSVLRVCSHVAANFSIASLHS
jgi:F-box/leucine-rich repeat protein 10/11